MSKYLLVSAAALTLLASPVAMAQNSEQMKGPPNANGMSNDSSSNAAGSMKSGDSGNANGAASAKATGEDKK
jgi:hypothetical protein